MGKYIRPETNNDEPKYRKQTESNISKSSEEIKTQASIWRMLSSI